jgi:hypothetical protein
LINRKVSHQILFVALFLVLYLSNLLSDWVLISFNGLRAQGYLDWVFVLHLPYFCTTEKGSDWSALFGEGLGDECPAAIYGYPLLLITKSLSGIFYLPSILEPSAIFLGILFSLVFALLLKDSVSGSKRKIVIVSLAVFSPPLILLFERANYDLVMALILILASWAFVKNRFVIAIVLVFISAVTKFYTLPLLWILAIWVPSLRLRLLALSAAILASYFVLRDLSSIEGIPVTGAYQFGVTVSEHYIKLAGFLPAPNWVVLGLGVLIPIVVVIFLMIQRQGFPSMFPNVNTQGGSFGVGIILARFSSVVLLSCYFNGLSFDYRLVFLIMAAVPFLANGGFTKAQYFSLWFLLLAALWGSTGLAFSFLTPYSVPIAKVLYAIQLIGDIALMFWIGALMFDLIRWGLNFIKPLVIKVSSKPVNFKF